jgi:hypothetical protein
MPAPQPRARVKTRWDGSLNIGLWAAFCAIWLAGCASPRPAGLPAAELAERLEALGPKVAPAEAELTAATAYSYSLELAREYRVVRPAIWHNVLVNWGVRKRGLCYQWADDLSAKLESLHLHALQVRRGVARLETRREHSSVVLTASGQMFDQGIVLDAWRHSGRLYWGPVRADKYPWIEVEVVAESEAQASRKSGH